MISSPDALWYSFLVACHANLPLSPYVPVTTKLYMKTVSRLFTRFLACLVAGSLVLTASAGTRIIRVACYNIEDDIDGATVPLPGLIAPPSNTNDVAAGGVLEGIGEEILSDNVAQPLDILALEETTSNPTTIAPIVSGMNTFYNSPGMYAMSTYQATESGGDTGDGNGPNALVYNTKTLQLIASVPVDPPGGTGDWVLPAASTAR